MDSQVWKLGEGRCQSNVRSNRSHLHGLTYFDQFASHRSYVCTSRRLWRSFLWQNKTQLKEGSFGFMFRKSKFHKHDPKWHHQVVCIIPVRDLLNVILSTKFSLIYVVSGNYIYTSQSTSIRIWAVTEINIELSFKEWELLYVFLLPNKYYNEEEFVVPVILARVLTFHWHMSDIKTLWTKNSQLS